MLKDGEKARVFLPFADALTVRDAANAIAIAGEKMRRTIPFALAAILALSSPLYAQVQPDGEPPPNDGPPLLDDSFTAKTLAAACQPPAGMEVNAKAAADQLCTSYLRGLTEGFYVMMIVAGGRSICLPRTDPISVADARQQFLDYLNANPDVADHSAGLAVILGVLKAHPCS
jgi:hypothetical protein